MQICIVSAICVSLDCPPRAAISISYLPPVLLVGDVLRMRQMFRDQPNKFEKTEPAWWDIALFGNNVIIAAGMIGILLIAGLGYYVLR